ncbi:MAG: hypothetical protein V5B59_12620 [Candidatus Accumulibacter contiguus]|jgi:hypothetical protein
MRDEFGLLGCFDDKVCIHDTEPGAIEQVLYVAHAKETDMGSVQQSPIAILEIALDQAGNDRTVRCMWKRDDQMAARCQQALGVLKYLPWIVEMLQHVGDNHHLEQALFLQAVRPIRRVQIQLDHPIAELPEFFDGTVVDFGRRHVAPILSAQESRDGTGAGADFEYLAVLSNKAHDTGGRGVIGQIHQVLVTMERPTVKARLELEYQGTRPYQYSVHWTINHGAISYFRPSKTRARYRSGRVMRQDSEFS